MRCRVHLVVPPGSSTRLTCSSRSSSFSASAAAERPRADEGMVLRPHRFARRPCVSMGVYVQCECDRGVRELGNSGIGDRGHRTGRVFYYGAVYCVLSPGESHSHEV